METIKDISRLSAFVTLKRMYNSKRTKNAVLSEFIYYVLKKESRVSPFSSSYIKEKLEYYFGFIIPLGVIENSLCRMDFVTRSVNEKNLNEMEYTPKVQRIQSMDVSVASQEIETLNNAFKHFCLERKYHYQESLFEESLCKFLLDEKTVENSEMREAISLFIFETETNSELKKILQVIKEGAILYLGLNYDMPAVKKTINLVLYLDIEVIFDLAGYNGELYKELAIEFISMVRQLNKKGHSISLKIFPEIEKEINNYFYSAEEIVSGRTSYSPRIAMRSIVEGCREAADVKMKKALLDVSLKNEYGIEIENTNFYDESFNQYNLETNSYGNDFELNDLRIISHVNKLRHGTASKQILNSRYLFVTETGSLLSSSEIIASEYNTCEFAVRIGLLTNLLWYHQCQGLGGAFPKNADIAIQAKTVLSRIIDTNVNKSFDEAKTSKYSSEEIDIFIESFHTIPTLPEQINHENGIESVIKSKETIEEFYTNLDKERALHKETEKHLAESKTENTLLSKKQKDLEEEIDSIKVEKNKIGSIYLEEKEKSNQEIRRSKRINHWLLVFVVALVMYIVIDKLGWASIIAQHISKNRSQIVGYLINIVISFSTSLFGNWVFSMICNHNEKKSVKEKEDE